jgi:hypothetical protein
MNTMATRGYVISRLDQRQLAEVHRLERDAGYCFPSGLLAARFRVSVGDVPDAAVRTVEIAVDRLAEAVRRRYRVEHTGCCFPPFDGRSDAQCPPRPEVAVQHRVDGECRAGAVAFPVQQTTRIRDRIGVAVS